jgi:serine/threonine-protein kinase SRPK3
VSIAQRDGCPLPTNVPAETVLPIPLLKRAKDFTLLDAQIMLGDFGEAFSPATTRRLGEDCHTPLAFRPPEAYFEPKVALSFASDIWSLGRAIWDLLGMQAVISSDFASEIEVVSQYVDVLGPMPPSWWDGWEERHQFFDEEQHRINPQDRIWSSMDHAFEEGVQTWRRKCEMGEFGEEEAAAILKLMRSMLAYRPEQRPSAEEILQSEWMVNWALPEFERARLLRHD